LNKILLNHLPANMDGAADVASRLVPEALDQIFRRGNWGTVKAGPEGRTTYVRVFFLATSRNGMPLFSLALLPTSQRRAERLSPGEDHSVMGSQLC